MGVGLAEAGTVAFTEWVVYISLGVPPLWGPLRDGPRLQEHSRVGCATQALSHSSQQRA